MSRIRTIKPDFFKSETIATLPMEARLLFIGLWTQADREGRLEDRPRRLKIEIFPWDEAVNVEALLIRLAAAELIVRYERDGRRLICVVGFLEHQRPHMKESPSTLPPPDLADRQISFDTARAGRAPELPVPALPFPVPAPDKPGFLSDARNHAIPSSPANPLGREGKGKGIDDGGKANNADVQFFAWADAERRKVYPNALPDPRPAGFEGWYLGALKVAGSDEALRGAWRAWLKDDWGRSLKTPCPLSAFIADRVWVQHVPGQKNGAKVGGGDRARIFDEPKGAA